MPELRPYQQSAVNAVYDHLRNRDDNPVIVLPTGSGKSWCLAQLASDTVSLWGGRALILAHRRELLEQNADKIRRLCPQINVGLYSAGLGKRDSDTSILVAGIQSVFSRACDLGAFDLIVIDEAHTLPASGQGMYRQFLAEAKLVNPEMRVVGLTATPYRLDSGSICTPEHFLNAVCFEAGVRELIADGYLCRLVSKAGLAKVDTTKLRVRAGEFVSEDVEQLMDQQEVIEAACREIVTLTKDRQSILIFTAGVKHGRHVQQILHEQLGVDCGFVCGETPTRERDEILSQFRGDVKNLFGNEPLQYLANANLLTEGFDAPRIDCVVLLRPTMSAGLLVQMCGRGFRLHPDKRDCLILDFAGNIERHGPIDCIKVDQKRTRGEGEAPAKECPDCQSLIACGYAICPDCGYEFPPPEKQQHDAKASNAGVLSGEVTDMEFQVRDGEFLVHTKRGAADDAPKTLRVQYLVGIEHWVSEWICFEHTG